MYLSPKDEPRWTGLREVVRMAWPIVLGSMSWTVMQFVDQVMVSKLGVEALAAVGSSGLWAFTLGSFFLGILGCVSTFVSQSLGRGEMENCARYTWQGLYVSVILGALSASLWFAAPWFFGLMGHSELATLLEIEYFQIRVVGYLFIGWQTVLACFFQATNRPLIPMYASILANVINIALDYTLIFGKWGAPALGIGGAAWATNAALAVQCAVLMAIYLNRSTNHVYNTRRTWPFDLRKARELYRIGWPAGASMFIDIANWGIFTSFIVGRFGDVALAANNAAINFMHISFLPAVGINHAIAPIVGQWIGKGSIEHAKARTYTALRITIVYMTFIGINLAIFGKDLMLVFSDEAEVIRMGHIILILAAVFQAFDATNIVIMGALRGAGDTRWLAVVIFIGAYLFFLPLACIFAWGLEMGALGAWFAAAIYIIGLSFLMFRRWHGENWRHIRIFEADKIEVQAAQGE